MASGGEDRFDGLLLRLAEEHTEDGIKEVSWRRAWSSVLAKTGRVYVRCALFGDGCTCRSSCILSLGFCGGRRISTLELTEERRRK